MFPKPASSVRVDGPSSVMRRRHARFSTALLVVAALLAMGAASVRPARAGTPVDSYCAPAKPGAQHRVLPLRFGVTSSVWDGPAGLAG